MYVFRNPNFGIIVNLRKEKKMKNRTFNWQKFFLWSGVYVLVGHVVFWAAFAGVSLSYGKMVYAAVKIFRDGMPFLYFILALEFVMVCWAVIFSYEKKPSAPAKSKSKADSKSAAKPKSVGRKSGSTKINHKDNLFEDIESDGIDLEDLERFESP